MTGEPGRRYPLVWNGTGWTELAEPEPGVRYDAYREVCRDRACLYAALAAEHSHIVGGGAGPIHLKVCTAADCDLAAPGVQHSHVVDRDPAP
jgi:hypothetical protein